MTVGYSSYPWDKKNRVSIVEFSNKVSYAKSIVDREAIDHVASFETA